LVLRGGGSALLAAGNTELGIGFVGVAIAFGLTVGIMAYAISHFSECRLNPAVSIGLWIGGRFDLKELLPYIISQVLGGIAGTGILS
jgi:aquaporin Z|tara:strand:- start:11787 stop:12047 length:261 start_codon:yes stop_codon:yes gene_type:complete